MFLISGLPVMNKTEPIFLLNGGDQEVTYLLSLVQSLFLPHNKIEIQLIT
jgi:hypothetical protein